MTTAVNLLPLVSTDGVQYCDETVLTGTEVDLFNLTGQAQGPAGVGLGNALYVFASLKLVVTGPKPGSGVAWVGVQTALSDNVWYDMGWVEVDSSILNGTYNYAFGTGSMVQSGLPPPRVIGVDPGPTRVSGLLLGGQLRFTGKSTFNQGAVAVTVYYKLQGLR